MATDLHIQLILPTQQRYGSNFTYGPKAFVAVAGMQKLADQWLKLFMTPKGSHSWRRAEGTLFPYLAGSNVVDPASVQVSVLEYIEDANTQMKFTQGRILSLPANERFASAELVQFTQVEELSFDIWVLISNTARERLSVLLPYVAY